MNFKKRFHHSKGQKISRYKLLPICFLMLICIMVISCQNDVDSVLLNKSNLKKESNNNVDKVSSSCDIPVDSIGVIHNVILERYNKLFNDYVELNNIIVVDESKMFNEEVFVLASLQVAIERCPSQDTSALRLVVEGFDDIEITVKGMIENIIDNSSVELSKYVKQLTKATTLSDIQSISTAVKSSNILTLKEKESFFVLSSTAENSFAFWSSQPNFGDIPSGMINVPERMLLDASATAWYWDNFGQYQSPIFGQLNSALYGAKVSAGGSMGVGASI